MYLLTERGVIVGSDNLQFSNNVDPVFDFEKFRIGLNEVRSKLPTSDNSAKDKVDSNPFPYGVFPLPLRQIVTETNRCLNFPIDFIGASLIYAASVAIGNSYRIEITSGWTESPVIYLALVAKPGTNKSAPLSFALRPIVAYDNISLRNYRREKLEYENQLGDLKKTKNEAVVGLSKPILNKKIVSDFTAEALASVHNANPRGLGVHADELAGWFKNFNRYNKGSEEEFWLSSWSGKPINIDRKSDEPIQISMPFISVAGTIQPKVLKQLAKTGKDDNGFMDRILFCSPDNLKKEYWKNETIDPSICKTWELVISKLMELPFNGVDVTNPQPIILSFTQEAKELLYSWQMKNTDRANDAENDSIAGIYSKLEIYVSRFALIMELLAYACGNGSTSQVGIESVRGALELTEYFGKCALKAHFSRSNPLAGLAADKRALYDALPFDFTTEEGLRIAVSLGHVERTFKRFLNEEDLFKRLSHGKYEKLY